MVMANVLIVRDCTSTGDTFVDRARRLAEKHKPDLFWADPLLAFIGGDLSNQETAGGFLRNRLNRLALAGKFAWMLIHHTPKPLREGTGYQGHDKAYSGFGSSELTNWARAVITLAPAGQDEDGTHVYRLEVSKRGKRSGLQSGVKAGEICATKAAVQPFVHLRHSDHGLAWIEAEQPSKKKPGPEAMQADFTKYKHYPCARKALEEWVVKETGGSKPTAERLVTKAMNNGILKKQDNGTYVLEVKTDDPF